MITRLFSYISIGGIKNWWRSLDKMLLRLICILFIVGIMTSFSVPSSNYTRLNIMEDKIINMRFLIFSALGFIVFFITSALPLKWIRILCVVLAFVLIVALILLLFLGESSKGATRWIQIDGISVQPSEFAKPIFAVVSAWFLSARFDTVNIPAVGISFGIFAVFAILFIIQPDLGQTLLLTGIWVSQLYMAGLAHLWLIVIGILVMLLILIAYLIFPHVSTRWENFLNGGYQVKKSLEAFQEGGFFGQGVGNGRIIKAVPELHTDFIFVVYAEKGGLIVTIAILLLFGAIIARMLWLIWHKNDVFSMLAMVGICAQFSMQTAINIASTIGLIPAKGMTLPLISMGGSSYVAVAGSLGLFMAFARRRKYEGV